MQLDNKAIAMLAKTCRKIHAFIESFELTSQIEGANEKGEIITYELKGSYKQIRKVLNKCLPIEKKILNRQPSSIAIFFDTPPQDYEHISAITVLAGSFMLASCFATIKYLSGMNYIEGPDDSVIPISALIGSYGFLGINHFLIKKNHREIIKLRKEITHAVKESDIKHRVKP